MPRYTAVTCGLLVAAATLGVGARAEDAGLKLRMLQGHPVVDGVYVNGHGPYRFLVDTGTSLNHLDPKIARSMGLTPTFRTEVMSSMGVTIAPGTSNADVVLGSLQADRQTFLLAGLEAVHQISPDIQGVLGQAFLSRFDYHLDVRAGRLSFGTLPVASGNSGTRVPFRLVRGRPAVSTSLGWLILDSGAYRLVLFGIARVKDEDAPYQMVTMSGTQDVGTVPRRLLIAGRTFWSGDAIGLAHAEDAGVAGLLPVNLFRAVYVCNSGGYVVFD